MVRIFLAASIRGDHAVLVLESRKSKIITKYRSMEIVTGVPATTSTSPNSSKKKVNPARARRSKLRLEQFHKRKEVEKMKKQVGSKAAGDLSSSTTQLVLNLVQGENVPVETGLHSPIIQVDGQEHPDENISFSFKSEYGEEDILYALEEMFPADVVTSTHLRSRVRLGALSADHQCIVSLRLPAGQTDFGWPESPSHSGHDDTFREVERIMP